MEHYCQDGYFKNLIKIPNGDSLNYLLVLPRITVLNDQQYIFPLGIAYVSSALKASGRKVWTLNLNYKDESVHDLLNAIITEQHIDVIATGGLTAQFHSLKVIIDTAKIIKPDIITIVGGGIITSDPVPAMTALENADYGIIGEGEITINDLAYALETASNRNSVNGLIYSDGGSWQVTAPRPEIDDLDIIPWPDYEGFSYGETLAKTPMDLLTSDKVALRVGSVALGRSCPYNCTFCFHSSGKKYRKRSLAGFFEELDFLMESYQLQGLYICDELFINDMESIRSFCARIKAYGLKWSIGGGRVDKINKEMIAIMKDSGCYRIGFGLESADYRILKSMRKHITVEQIDLAISLCYEAGMEAQGCFIFGDLEETTETARNTINWWKDRPQYHIFIRLAWIMVYPGSHLYRVACSRGIIKDRIQYIKDGCPEINISKLTDHERRNIAREINLLADGGHDHLTDAILTPGRSGKVTVTGRCPYCQQLGTWCEVDPFRPLKSEICPACGHILRFYASDYIDQNKFNQNISYILQTSKVALWPVFPGITRVFERAPVLGQHSEVYIVDSSSYKQGTDICGKIVGSPYRINTENIGTIFLTLTTQTATQICDQIQHNFPSVKHIYFIGDLIFSSRE